MRFTQAATRTLNAERRIGAGVYTRLELLQLGCTRSQITARIAARRWRAIGRAVVLSHAELTREQAWRVAVLNCGPRAALASFSAAEFGGLTGWGRDEIHVLVPAGARRPDVDLPIVLHRARRIDQATVHAGRRCQRIAPALVLAASSFANPRPACGLVAAGVQQRVVTAAHLRAAVLSGSTLRHRGTLVHAINDIEMGAQALSEIDFVRLCRRNGLPSPRQQSVRIEPNGLRRYLDADWLLPDGRRVVAEVDGALHLAPQRWYEDQLRQNEVAIGGALMLRYPSVVVRSEEPLVVDQLRRALFR